MSEMNEARCQEAQAAAESPPDLDAARSAALRDPAWQEPASASENITFEEFRDVLTAEMWRWMPHDRPLTLASWWLYVKQFSSREFNRAYDREYPKKPQPDTSYEDRLRASGHLK